MSEHDEVREMLALAAAGALVRAEEARLTAHLAACAECSVELEKWQMLAGGLKRLPTPQPSAATLERARTMAERQFAAEAETRWNRKMLIFLMLFAWALTVASWPVVRLFGRGMLGWLEPGFAKLWWEIALYAGLVWIPGAVAAGLLANRQRRERRTI
ncbi:MAG: zf-HC2 domain-containing protein [Candidatus Acidiferrales bacterium]